MGYDALGGLRLAAGELQTVEKVIAVPAGQTDTRNLLLQFNLGKTTSANEVTVSGVKVEEISLAHTDIMPKNDSFTSGGALSIWTYTDYEASLESTEDSATLHITGVPATGAEVWKAKLLIKTGAMLSAGKSYLVRANLRAAKAQEHEVCFNNEETEKGFDALYGQKIAAGVPDVIEKQITVPAAITDAGELILQFSVGGPVTNDITVSGVTVQELSFGGSGAGAVPETIICLRQPPLAAPGSVEVKQGVLLCRIPEITGVEGGGTVTVAGADLRPGGRTLHGQLYRERGPRDHRRFPAPSGGRYRGRAFRSALPFSRQKSVFLHNRRSPSHRGVL